MSTCACCSREIKQNSPVYTTKDGEELCYRCDRYDMYTEQGTITKDNCYNRFLYAEGKEDFLLPREPVDVRKVRYPMLGFGGAWWKFEMFDGSVLYSNNVWCTISVKNIPEKLKDLIHSNIKSITNVSNREGLEAMGWLESPIKPINGMDVLDDGLPF